MKDEHPHTETDPTTDQLDPIDHPWIEEMRQYEPLDEELKEAEEWF